MKNNVPGLIRPVSQPAMFVAVNKNTVKMHPTNQSMVRMHILKGWRRKMGKAPMKMYEEYDIPRSYLYAYPGGLDVLMLTPDRCKFVCGVRDECLKDLMKELQKKNIDMENMKWELNQAQKLAEDAKKELEKVQKQMSMLKS